MTRNVQDVIDTTCNGEVTSFFIRQIEQGRLNQRAAAISFNFIMALPPACIFLFSLVPLFPIADQFYNEVNSFVREITPNEATRNAVESFLADFFKRPNHFNLLTCASAAFLLHNRTNLDAFDQLLIAVACLSLKKGTY